MKRLQSGLLVFIFVLAGLGLGACGSLRSWCSPSGLCAETPAETQPNADAGLIVVHPGETRVVKVRIDLQGLPEDTPLEFGSRLADASRPNSRSGTVLATFDQGRVVVRAPAPGFTAATATIRVSAAAEATLTSDPGQTYVPDRLFVRKQQSRTERVSSLVFGVRVLGEASATGR